ncbi:glycosyl hydrolase family 28-related protein [Streptomyces sp. NPDC059740]|uniref:glycosyl hydrolase family 28-related protein n=1 Tax=Streptomyces sp. NPDC059740 TaxID=3346926 RepID=UPI003661219F
MAAAPRPSTSGTPRRAVLAGAAAALGVVAAGCDADRGPADGRAPVAPVVTGRPPRGSDTVDVVRDCGARGDGRTDDSEAFARAYRHAESRVWDHVGRTVVTVPAGTYLVRRPGALLDADGSHLKANGLRFEGAGKRMTQIVFAPARPHDEDAAADTYLCRNNDAWANVSFERIAFRSATPGVSFFSSYSTGQAQDYRFSECEWTGEWGYGLALDGSNTNSEMRWEACRVGGAYRRAFLYSGLSHRTTDVAAQDQFLNYWFTDMKVEYEWGDFLDFPYGGSITCRGGSYIVTGRRPGGAGKDGPTSTFFRFPRGPHHDSVQRFHAEDIRFEVRGPDTVVIDCAWDSGTVHFNDCDDTAHAFRDFAAGTRPHRYRAGPRGPLVRYDSCQLSGHHEYRRQGGGPRTVRYDMCLFANHSQHDFCSAGGEAVRFVDCLGR